MKAIVQERFGPPDILQLVDTDPPEVGADDVLVRVHAAALNPYDWHIMRGDPLISRLMGEVGLRKPKARVAGVDAAGRVEAVGGNVRGLRPGDEVLGFCRGAFAEYARAEADKVVPKPVGLTFQQAAAVPMAGTTALRGIRDVGAVRAGHRVLVNGAAGGVGTYAVQIAAALGAEVTGVCSTRNVELVRSTVPPHSTLWPKCPPKRSETCTRSGWKVYPGRYLSCPDDRRSDAVMASRSADSPNERQRQVDRLKERI
jgi:NADPH:quinone reductase-like Zn-dependent oxidoreductase